MSVIFNKFFKVSSYFLFVVALSGCPVSKNENNIAEKNSDLPTIEETLWIVDAQAVDAAESKLTDLGLKFVIETSTSEVKATWDQSFVESKVQAGAREIIQQLDAYTSAAQTVIDRYSASFNLKKLDGTLAPMKLKNEIKQQLKVKLSLAGQTKVKLQPPTEN